MKRMINTEHIEGRIYQHDLAVKTVQNQQSPNFGKEFIGGTIDVATDEAGLNIIQVHFTYVTETTKSGGKSPTYAALKRIINEGKAIITDGKDAATKVKIDTSLGLNDFYGQDGSLVSVKVNEGGFVSIVAELNPENERNTFTADMLITNIVPVEADPEKNITEPYVTVRGAIFNFRNNLLPVDFIVKNEQGMKYFEGLDVSPAAPIFTKVWGRINAMTTIVESKEESAFGEAAVKTYERKSKEWIITGTSKFAYDFGDESALTAEEVTKAMQNREIYLADIKKRADEYRTQKSASTSSTNMPGIAQGGFNF